jgi:hypothetical protein
LQVAGGVGIGGTLVANQMLVNNVANPNFFAIYGSQTATPGSTNYVLQGGGTGGAGQTYLNSAVQLNLVISGSDKVQVTSTSVKILPSTAATSTITGALQVIGGVGIGGSLYAGNIYTNGQLVNSAGGGAGSLTPTYIAYGKADGSITGTSHLVYNSTNDTIRLGDPAATTYIMIGHGESSTSDGSNIGIGYQALYAAASGGINNIAFGYQTLRQTTTGDNNVAIGYESGLNNTTGNDSTFLGYTAGKFFRSSSNTAIGSGALTGSVDPSTGNFNTALGYNASNSWSGYSNTTALGANSTILGNNSTALGAGSSALGNNSTALGAGSSGSSASYSNTTALGYNSVVDGSNQVQLGNSLTTTYAYGAVQNRSDQRDKAEIRDTQLGLDFVLSLRPVDYKWDMREDYKPARPDIIKPELPNNPTAEQTAEYNIALDSYNSIMLAWQQSIQMSNLVHDGSKIRTRYHHGLIAQEVKSVMDSKGIDFGGYQDHSVKGGEDVLSIGYSELIAPLIKAIQELNAKVDALSAKVNS